MFPSVHVFRRLGGTRVLAGKVREYCGGRPDYADLLDMPPEMSAEEPDAVEDGTDGDGEWFEPTRADVTAFKRRKFM